MSNPNTGNVILGILTQTFEFHPKEKPRLPTSTKAELRSNKENDSSTINQSPKKLKTECPKCSVSRADNKQLSNMAKEAKAAKKDQKT